MTEFELASLALRESALWVAIGQVAATLVIGLGQTGIVWYGIRAMNRSGAERVQDRRQRERAETQRHAEAMQRHTEASERHAEAMAALDLQRRALETLIERTAPARETTP